MAIESPSVQSPPERHALVGRPRIAGGTHDALPAHPSEDGPLGNSAKYGSAQSRAERFALQAVSRLLLPKDRVARCLRVRQGGADVSVWKSVEHQKAHYKGLQTCGSVWHCPVCAAKVAERRRAELVAAIASWQAGGGRVLFLTLTNRHDRSDSLSDLLSGQQKALSRFWKDRASRKLWDEIDLQGQIRALEVTHGASGWHPHYHVLLFVRAGVGLSQNWDTFRHLLAVRWQECCRAAGLPLPDLTHGCTLQDGAYAARYAAKWGAPEEMTRGHTKKARGGLSPWDMLRLCLETGEAQPAALFAEYASAFKGRRQLHWSRGLRALLQVEDLSDEDISSLVEEDSIHLATLSVDQWRAVLFADLRAQLLAAAESGSLPQFLDALPIRQARSVWLASRAGLIGAPPDRL